MPPRAGHRARHADRAAAASSSTVRVDLNKRGDWEIALPDQHDPVTCKTLAEAKRIAYLHATRRQPSELLMLDAYHRVLHHELIGN